MAVVVCISVCAAFLFAIAAFMQHRAAVAVTARIPTATGLPRLVHLIATLIRTPSWVIGWLTNLVGFATQAFALHLGALTVVQPLASTQLLFSLPLAAGDRRSTRPRARDWLFALSMCIGLAVLLLSQNGTAHAGHPVRSKALVTASIALCAVTLAVMAALHLPPRVGACLLAVGAGICYAMTAVFIKLMLADLVGHGPVSVITDWPVYGLVASTMTGLTLGQNAFAAGPLPWVLSAMSVTNPAISYVAGVYAFGVMGPRTVGEWLDLVMAAALIGVGLVGIATSPAVRSWYEPEPVADESAGSPATALDDHRASKSGENLPQIVTPPNQMNYD